MSLRTRILLLVLAATLAPVFAMGWMLFGLRDADVESARLQLAAQATGYSEDLEDRISGTAQLLFGLARAPILASRDKAACSDFLGEVLKAHPQYTGVLTILPNGDVHCDSLRSGRVLNVADRDYFKRALQSGRHVVEPAFGRITGTAVMQVAHAVRAPNGALRYVLLASVDLNKYARTAAGTLPHPGAVLRLWDRNGIVLARQPDTADERPGSLYPDPAVNHVVLARGLRGAYSFEGASDGRVWTVAALSTTRGTGMRITIDVARAELYTQANRRLGEALLWLTALALLLCAGAAALAEFAVRRQAARLIEAVARIDAGDLAARIGGPYPRGELGEVMAALDRTAASLEAQRNEIVRANDELSTQANYDALTGLANRNLLADRVSQTLVHAARAGRVAAVLLLDLDRFKTVNDSLGHNQGDALLREVAARLRASVREGDTVARLGGDEFVIVLADMAKLTDAIPFAHKVLAALAAPLHVGGRELTVGASIGISGYPADGEDANVLLRNADVAMYRAKGEGGGAYCFFTREMNARAVERLEIEAGLRRAIDRNELELHFQPIVDARTARIRSAEALVRWRHPEQGLVPPGRFIPVAEESGLILALGDWVLRRACEQATEWRRRGLPPLRIAVNMSGRQFAEANLAATVSALLAETGCDPEWLEIEITESAIMQNPDAALLTMHRINQLGVRLSIDDFGTGYSSLAYLKRFPVHKLKIDRSFVRDIHVDADDAAIVGAIVALARNLELQVVAEGVETPEQLQFLESLGCDECQGYLFSKPRPAEEFAQLLRAAPRSLSQPLSLVRPALASA
jgi:diguanylate cyclase (GGDEF)-like protein